MHRQLLTHSVSRAQTAARQNDDNDGDDDYDDGDDGDGGDDGGDGDADYDDGGGVRHAISSH